ncbi:hypothetical protein GGI15_000458 [Coemansia interrupta]|uniref:TPX2 C-terminal domain-containing protein n=1 Tax=Coemansia interrupta TaxID=1126814 RepID=A0A9W8HLZ0_9FUNG|nr:hypothetical protein GGI15_000458 [Coemansia interrupta]
MTKSPSSGRKSAAKAASSPSALATPRRKSIRGSPQASNDVSVGDVWDFDAPQFYDFASAKTPGPKADKWFDYAHPTPAVKKTKASRLSRLSFLSTDSRESLLPTRLSLSPSRIVVEENGRLTIDDEPTKAKKKRRTSTAAIQSVEFSDTDDEIEFNKWKSGHALPTDGGSGGKGRKSTANGDGEGRRDTVVASDDTEKSAAEDFAQLSDKSAQVSNKKAQNKLSTDSAASGSRARGSNAGNASSAGTTGSTSARSTNKPTIPIRTAGAKVSKKPVAETVPKTAPSTSKTLTVPVEQCGFMRPTKVATRRLQVKKRDKLDQQAIAQAIAKSVSRRLSHNKGTILTMPKPFHFHDSKSSDAESQAEEPNAEQAAEKRLSKKAQERLIAKLTSKQRSATSENAAGGVDATKQKAAVLKKPTAARILKPTVPMTPQFAKSKRLRDKIASDLADEANEDDDPYGFEKAAREIAKAKARASHVPEKPAPLKTTVPQPFTFRSDAAAERHLLRLREEIAKLKAEEEALRQFRANPLPEFPTPKKRKRQPTQQLHTSPFQLETDVRGETYQRQLRERLAELEQRQRERQEFRARPIPASIDHPFVPQPSTHPLTASEEVLLKTELRSEERRAFDDDRAERERIREEVLERKRVEEEKREDEEIKRLRKLLVHKAQPIRHYKPVDVKPSDRPLTVPKTPLWNVRTREHRPASTSLEATPTK